MFVPWRWLVPWRGVAWVGGAVLPFRLAGRFLRCVGRGVLVGFFIWDYSGVFFGPSVVLLCSLLRGGSGVSCGRLAHRLVYRLVPGR